MDTHLNVEKTIKDGICTIVAEGVLDYSTADPFNEAIEQLESPEKVIIDFTKLEFIDSTGIGSILNLIHQALSQRFEVDIIGLNEDVQELLETIGVFEIIDTLAKGGE